jgi:hypothetical protein
MSALGGETKALRVCVCVWVVTVMGGIFTSIVVVRNNSTNPKRKKRKTQKTA